MLNDAKRELREWVEGHGGYKRAAGVLGCPQSNLYVWANQSRTRPPIPWAFVIEAVVGLPVRSWCSKRETARLEALASRKAAA